MSLKPHKINVENNFIAGWYLEDFSICDELIKYYQDSPDKRAGLMTGYLGEGDVDTSSKDSTDVTLPPGDTANRYIKKLNEVAREYISKYSFCNKLVPWGVIEPIAIQYYKPGGGYKVWHFERDNTNELIARRHLAFMSFLNDVHEGGGTSFYYQNVSIKAEKGLTLIWPAEWMHTHKGVVSYTEEKYIVTGWFSTYTSEEFAKLQKKVTAVPLRTN